MEANTSIQDTLEKFLNGESPRVIALTGVWGCGKTHTWKKALKKYCEPDPKKQVIKRSHSTVSLFGVEDLKDLKNQIILQSSKISDMGATVTTKGLSNNKLAKALGQLFDKALSTFGRSEGIGDLVAHSLFESTVNDHIICLDDLERRPESLSIQGIFGLINHLQETKNCRVIVIMNKDRLSAEDAVYLAATQEKVFDTTVELSLDTQEAFETEITIKKTHPGYETIKECAKKLKISNVRILRRIEENVNTLSAAIVNPKLTEQIYQSSVLLTWTYYSRGQEGVPDFEYVKDVNSNIYVGLLENRTDLSEEKQQWNTLLREYGYTHSDELDGLICEYLELGWLDRQKAALINTKFQESQKSEAARLGVEKAWSIYHDSFDEDNAEELFSALEEAYINGASYIDLNNLNETVKFMKEMGEGDRAERIIDACYQAQATSWGSLDGEGLGHTFSPLDPDISALQEAAQEKYLENINPVDRLMELSEKGTDRWRALDNKILGRISVDRFYSLFKELRGKQLSKVVRTALQISSSSQNAHEALERVGSESTLNQERIKKYFDR